MGVFERSDTSNVQNVPDSAARQLELQHVICAGQHTLRLTGELDIASCPALDAALPHICTDKTAAVVLDLSELTFLDCTGIHAILAAQRLCQEHGCEFLLVPGTAQVQRVFEVCGLLDQLHFRTDENRVESEMSGGSPRARERFLTGSRRMPASPLLREPLVR
jgi:anti-anti-sigma factor